MGFAFDAGSGGQQLTAVFSALYVIGCLVAVLAVRQSGLFTAVIQPPLVLFLTAPGAYFLMRSGEIQGIKDILINCGYPLIERFPLMFFTSAAVLLIGLARWYFGKSVPAAAPEKADEPASAERAGGLSAKLSSFLGGATDTETADEKPRERRASDRRRTRTVTPASGRTARSARTDKRATPRSRHSRPSESEVVEPVAERPRRRRPRPGDEPPESSAEPRRRPRPSSRERDARDAVPPRDRRAQYDRDDRYERQRPQRSERPQRRSRFDEYGPLDPYGSNGTSTHHPISRVRYRGGDDNNDRPESRPQQRAPRDADRWEYDI